MILSHQHRFIFIKGRKVAGTSVEMALSAICGPHDVVTPFMGVDERARIGFGGEARNYAADRIHEAAYRALVLGLPAAPLARLRLPKAPFFNHMALRRVQSLAGPLSGYRVIVAERSPYAKLISWINMFEMEAAYRVGAPMRGNPAAFERRLDRMLALGRVDIVRNIDLYRDITGALNVEVLRYDTLQLDLDAFAASLGVTVKSLPHAKRGLLSNAIDPRTVFRRDRLDRIGEIYAEEFEAFGFPML